MANFTLADDGTLDTVVQCNRCGEQERYDSASLIPEVDEDGEDITDEKANEYRIRAALQWAEQDHECEV